MQYLNNLEQATKLGMLYFHMKLFCCGFVSTFANIYILALHLHQC